MQWKRFWAGVDWGARGDFILSVVSHVFDYRPWVSGFFGGGMTFIWAAIDGRSPLDVWLMALFATACVAIVVMVGVVVVQKIHSAISSDSVTSQALDYAEHIPDIRVADDPVVLQLFEGLLRDRLLPLLEAGKLTAWGRSMRGDPVLTAIRPEEWRSHNLRFIPGQSGNTINQTFFQTKLRQESTYYDVHLNASQIEKIWAQGSRGHLRGARLQIIGPELSHGSDARFYRWKIVVRNDGPETAINVRMRLRDIAPRPKYPMWAASYPYLVAIRGPGGSDVFECRILRNDQEIFEVITGWPNNGDVYTSGLDTKSNFNNHIAIELDEKWELKYDVTAENADPIEFSLEATREDRALMLKRKY